MSRQAFGGIAVVGKCQVFEVNPFVTAVEKFHPFHFRQAGSRSGICHYFIDDDIERHRGGCLKKRKCDCVVVRWAFQKSRRAINFGALAYATRGGVHASLIQHRVYSNAKCDTHSFSSRVCCSRRFSSMQSCQADRVREPAVGAQIDAG